MKRSFINIEENPESRNQVKKLKIFSDEQPKQRTEGWFALRKKRITASDVGSCLRKNFVVCDDYIKEFELESYEFTKDDRKFCNPYSDENEFIIKKHGYKKFESNVATRWGNKYEMAACKFYETIINEKVEEYGLILHEHIDWLACSPDGITDSGRMVEIKCPFKRKITGLPPIYYWIQVQIQLEVCDLQECDFIECVIKIIDKETYLGADIDNRICFKESNKVSDRDSKGIIVKFKNLEKPFYPPRTCITKEDKIKWAEKKCKKYYRLDPEIEYYYITEYSLCTIQRNKKWFEKVKPMLMNTWKKVENFDYEKYKHIIEKKKEPEIEESYLDNGLDECIL